MTKGRPADPTRAKRGTGNRPQVDAGAAIVPIEKQFLPEPPADLPEEAQEMFRRVIQELSPRGLREADLESITMMCHSAWLHSEARRRLTQTGVLLKTPRGVIVNPLIKVARDEASTYLRLADAFGLTLASRLRLGLMQLTGESILQSLNNDLDTTVNLNVKLG